MTITEVSGPQSVPSALGYPKRLFEVDLPIKRISAHARREKSIRHGHISTLHIWWARRPLAACRAVICAALWPDPADPACPPEFRQVAQEQMRRWATAHVRHLSGQSLAHFLGLQKDLGKLSDDEELRDALLHFIADFANWDNSSKHEYLETSRALTHTAHESMGGVHADRPLVVDPFAGGGAIPLEALRVGADVFASDLNPVAVLLNKTVLEYIPRFGDQLADQVRKWGSWVRDEARRELADFYPGDPDGSVALAYIWTRTLICEGPGCGTEIPLLRSPWLARREKRSAAFRIVPRPEDRRVDLEIVQGADVRDVGEGTIRRGATTCPNCGFTTPVATVRRQLKSRHGGTADARLVAVVTAKAGQSGRGYRAPTARDLEAVRKAAAALAQMSGEHRGALSLVPDDSTEHYHSFVNRGPIYGMTTWGDYFTARQALALATLVAGVRRAGVKIANDSGNPSLALAVETCLALAFDRQADAMSQYQ